MSDLAKSAESQYVIMDFVCPTRQLREIVAADVNIFMNTIVKGASKTPISYSNFDSDQVVIQFRKKC